MIHVCSLPLENESKDPEFPVFQMVVLGIHRINYGTGLEQVTEYIENKHSSYLASDFLTVLSSLAALYSRFLPRLWTNIFDLDFLNDWEDV